LLDSDKPGSNMVEIQCLLDNVGASELVIDLIVNTKNDRVFEESILLGIALLQGGNTRIQVGSADTHIHSFPPNALEICHHLPSASQAEFFLQPITQAEEV